MPRGTYRYIKIEEMAIGEEKMARIKLKKKKDENVIMDIGIYGENKKEYGIEQKGRILIKERGVGNRMKRPELGLYKVLRISRMLGLNRTFWDKLFYNGELWAPIKRVDRHLWVIDVPGIGFGDLGRVKWYQSWSRIGRAFESGWAYLEDGHIHLEPVFPFERGSWVLGDGFEFYIVPGVDGGDISRIPVEFFMDSYIWKLFGEDFVEGRRVFFEVFGSLPVKVLFQKVQYV